MEGDSTTLINILNHNDGQFCVFDCNLGYVCNIYVVQN